MKEMNIPVGVSDFEEIRKNGYYYIDKSGLIRELLSRTGTEVTLDYPSSALWKDVGHEYAGKLLRYPKGQQSVI